MLRYSLYVVPLYGILSMNIQYKHVTIKLHVNVQWYTICYYDGIELLNFDNDSKE